MTGYEGTSGKLQGNPKLHKPGMPLRTIVNGRNHPTEKMAEIVEDELREHVTSLPSYIRDTTDFLNKIKNIPQPLPEGTLIFCLDVKALYPSVPRTEARAAVIEALNGRSNPEIPTEDVVRMMDTVLENNTISFYRFCLYIYMHDPKHGKRINVIQTVLHGHLLYVFTCNQSKYTCDNNRLIYIYIRM